jgi:hypothetical protein
LNVERVSTISTLDGAAASMPYNWPRSTPLLLALAVAICGALMSARVTLVGEVHLGEILLIFVALLVIFLRGVGPRQTPWFAWIFGLAAFGMLIGYIVSDIAVASSPGQYLRGWARVSVLAFNFLALLLLVSHSERLLGWFLLGLALGILVDALFTGTPFNVVGWKEGYAFPLGILLALWVGRRSTVVAGLLMGAFGIVSVLLDFRSLGGVFLVSSGIVLAHVGGDIKRHRHLVRGLLVVTSMTVAILVAWMALSGTDAEYRKRRDESDIGRYAGLVVALDAISDSPLIGYGSWAADKTYIQKLMREVEKESIKRKVQVDIGKSILPHSQLLQAWVEGGLLAGVFFVLYGLGLLGGLRWLVLDHRPNPLTAVYAVLVINGLWDLCFSPFLGPHRINICCALAATSLLAWEWRMGKKHQGFTRRPGC